MKRIILLLVIFSAIFTHPAFALNDSQNIVELDKLKATESALDDGVDEYQLPYPGILPDNPLYPIKTLRDRVVSFLISDPLKKAEFNLLQADKRLQAGIYLIETSNKHDLAIDTISKGENYFEEALIKTDEIIRQRTDIGDIIDKLNKSVVKHKKIIKGLLEKAPTEKKPGYEILLKRVEKHEKQVSKFKP